MATLAVAVYKKRTETQPPTRLFGVCICRYRAWPKGACRCGNPEPVPPAVGRSAESGAQRSSGVKVDLAGEQKSTLHGAPRAPIAISIAVALIHQLARKSSLLHPKVRATSAGQGSSSAFRLSSPMRCVLSSFLPPRMQY